jgi:hypothetical protein
VEIGLGRGAGGRCIIAGRQAVAGGQVGTNVGPNNDSKALGIWGSRKTRAALVVAQRLSSAQWGVGRTGTTQPPAASLPALRHPGLSHQPDLT